MLNSEKLPVRLGLRSPATNKNKDVNVDIYHYEKISSPFVLALQVANLWSETSSFPYRLSVARAQRSSSVVDLSTSPVCKI